MEKLKIKFCDFWQFFHPHSNYFYNLLCTAYDVELSDEPDLIIFSCYGNEHLKYKCIRIFYTAENMRPDFTGCDFAIGFDFINDPGYLRLPLYALYIDQHPGSMDKLTMEQTKDEALVNWRSKTKFCCMVVSNDTAKKRIDFFKKLSGYKQVDSGGLVLNNVGGPVANKVDFIKDYRFVLAFENSAWPGYTTEKIMEPFITGSIPLYWGNPLIEKDFNPAAFLRLNDTITEENFINTILEIENDESKAVEFLMQPKFNSGKIPAVIDKNNVLEFFGKIVRVKDSLKPVASTGWTYLHQFNLKKNYYKKRITGIVVNMFTR
jgi:hypothetical protein